MKNKTPKFWFKHDCFPESKESFRNLTEQFGAEGAAVYYRLKELLYRDDNAELPYYDGNVTWVRIGSMFKVPPDKTKQIVDFMMSSPLFAGLKFDDLQLKHDPERNVFFSEVIRKDKNNIMSLSEKRAEAGRKGGYEKNKKFKKALHQLESISQNNINGVKF